MSKKFNCTFVNMPNSRIGILEKLLCGNKIFHYSRYKLEVNRSESKQKCALNNDNGNPHEIPLTYFIINISI